MPWQKDKLAPSLSNIHFSCSTQIEHEISTAHKTKMLKYKDFFLLKHSNGVFILLINVEMPTIVGILTFMSRINFMLSVS